MLEKYAELIVRQGVNLQPGQELVITTSIECFELARAITKHAFAIGAKDVIVDYNDTAITRMRYENCSLEHFQNVPQHIVELKNQYALKNAASLFIVSSDPEAMKGIDPQKIQAWNIAMKKACETFFDYNDKTINRWCIVAAPSVAWAQKVFPKLKEQDAVDKMWEMIFKVTRCDQVNPVEAWNEHAQSFQRRTKILNEKKIKSLHYQNKKGTDLTIGLPEGYLFSGGGNYTTDGIYAFPNMPTEEIFGSPHREQVDGIVYSSLPLNYGGNLIDEFSLTFEKGRIVDYSAKVGYDVLKSIIETDDGSHYLGEVALVPYDSPIRNLDVLFYNTLYDENAACHLAIGKGFPECFQDGIGMTKEELFEKGINDSATHVDFMIGTKDLSIVATLESGEEFVIFKDGNYAF